MFCSALQRTLGQNDFCKSRRNFYLHVVSRIFVEAFLCEIKEIDLKIQNTTSVKILPQCIVVSLGSQCQVCSAVFAARRGGGRTDGGRGINVGSRCTVLEANHS